MLVSQSKHSGTPDSFLLQNNGGTPNSANQGTNCDREFISIESTQVSMMRAVILQ